MKRGKNTWEIGCIRGKESEAYVRPTRSQGKGESPSLGALAAELFIWGNEKGRLREPSQRHKKGREVHEGTASAYGSVTNEVL